MIAYFLRRGIIATDISRESIIIVVALHRRVKVVIDFCDLSLDSANAHVIFTHDGLIEVI